VVSLLAAASIMDSRGLRVLVLGPIRRGQILGCEGLADPPPTPEILREDNKGAAARITRVMKDTRVNRVYVPCPQDGDGASPVIGVYHADNGHEYIVCVEHAYASGVPLKAQYAYLDDVAEEISEIAEIELVRPQWATIPHCGENGLARPERWHDAGISDYQYADQGLPCSF